MLNLMFTGSLGAMPAKLRSDDGRNTVIRPLLYAAEATIERYARARRFPILPCNLCGSQQQLKRRQVKRWLSQLEQIAPQVRQSMLAALGNVRASHLLDRDLLAELAAAEDQSDAARHEDAPERGRLPLLL